MSDFQPEHSRLSTRGRKRKQNRLLNLSIVIVCLLILVVGYSIFFSGGGGSQKADSNSHTSSQGSNNGGGNGPNSAPTSGSHKKNKGSQSPTQKNSSAGTGASSTNKNNAGKSKNNNQKITNHKQQKTTGPHHLAVPQGPWKPVATQQQSPHHTSYSSGSQDWTEQMQALYEATGLSSSDSTLWWLGRDGSTNQSVGYLSPKNDPNAFYIVHIEWVDQKGWKPVQVGRKYIQDPQAWYKQKSG